MIPTGTPGRLHQHCRAMLVEAGRQCAEEAGRADRTQEKLDSEFAARKRAETTVEQLRVQLASAEAEVRFREAHQCQTPRDDLIRHQIAIQVLQQILLLLGPEPKAPTMPATDEG